jgi:putative transposase
MPIAHRMTLAPNNAQRTRFAKVAGVARKVHDWALAVWRRMRGARKNAGRASAGLGRVSSLAR